jgi:hypothetical protein
MQLVEFQSAFAHWVLRGASPEQMSADIKANGLTAEQCLNVYRNNTQLGLTEALRDGYPVVNKLVGPNFFNRMARDYIRQFPPKAGCLLFFGGRFAYFIQTYPPAKQLPYLPDVAQLEWLWHEAFHEADASTLALSALAGIAPECYGKLVFTLHPTARLLASNYPVLTIWQGNQDVEPNEPVIDLGQGGCQLLVFRPEWEVLLVALDEAEFDFLTEVQRGATLNQAAGSAVAVDDSFNLIEMLQRGFDLGFFNDYSITQDED